ncbi:GNAT family N-acetyltransferase [Gillisia marina]|uniref:GNAT family N-acetyltransferase n=1 Tax=Gillisia marina TaxID=1167637 RepID=UPI00029AA006|nr:GNAT family N-acetyltransferase [Gillisia marina]
MNHDPTYQTERLILRPTTLEDAALFLKLLNTPKWLQFIGDRNIKNLQDAEAYIHENILPVFKKNGFGNFTVIRKSDDVKIGCCGLYDRLGVEGIDIGFAFLPEYERQGYALESSAKIKAIAISDFGLTQISAITNPENLGSQKLLEKLELNFSEMITLPKSEERLMLYKWRDN